MSNYGRGGSGLVKWALSNFGGPLGPVKVETAVGPQRLCAPQAEKFCRALVRAPYRRRVSDRLRGGLRGELRGEQSREMCRGAGAARTRVRARLPVDTV